MGVASRVLAYAQDRLGLYEQPDGSNYVPSITDVHGFWNDAWCDMFVSDCLIVGGGFEEAVARASCYYSVHDYQVEILGTWIGKPDISEVAPGDQIFYGNGGKDHTGLVAWVDIASRRVLTYEGNWANHSLAQWRRWDDSYVYGVGRPPYEFIDLMEWLATQPAPVPDPTPIQTPTPVPATPHLEEDVQYVLILKERKGVEDDGVTSIWYKPNESKVKSQALYASTDGGLTCVWLKDLNEANERYEMWTRWLKEEFKVLGSIAAPLGFTSLPRVIGPEPKAV